MQDHETLVMDTIRGIVERRTGSASNVTLEADLISDLEMQSIEIAELSAILEEEYGKDPYSAGTLARTAREVLAFYQATGATSDT